MSKAVFALVLLLVVVVASSKNTLHGFPSVDIISDLERSPGVKLREWPWPAWSSGPPCPNRYTEQLLPITGDQLDSAVRDIRALCEIWITQLKDIGVDVGISVGAVYDQQEIFSEGFGSISVGSTQAPSETTVFNIGSVTKIFTSLALYNSVQNNQVGLTDPVTKFFNEEQPPVFSIHNPYSSQGADAVTLHSLASQASGLPREPFCGAYPLTANCSDLNQAAQINLEHLSKFGLLYSPFSGSHYSNLGLALLGRSLERVWGEQYETYMENSIFPNIGMTQSTGFTYTSDVIANMATGYIVEQYPNGTYYQIPAVQYNTQEFGWSAPAGGAYTTRSDMMNFFKWVFGSHNGTLLSESYLDEFIAPGMLLPDGISHYGQGTWESVYANGYWTFTKGGLTASMGTSISLVPALKLGITVMFNINSGIDSDKLNTQINGILVPAIEEALASVQTPLSLPSNWDSFLGSYGYNGAAYITFEEADDTATTGVLSGEVIGVGTVNFIWDRMQSYEEFTAFRYSSTSNIKSCLSLTGIGNNAIVYFSMINGAPHATLADENASLYDLPLLK